MYCFGMRCRIERGENREGRGKEGAKQWGIGSGEGMERGE